MITNIPCVILSGGKSSRMGEDKSLLPFGEFDTMCEYQYNKLSKIFKDVYISSKTDKFNFPAKLILDDDKGESSPLVALNSIFNQLDCSKVFIITVDTPLVEKETILSLIDNSLLYKYDVVTAKDDEKKHFLCGVYSNTIKATLSLQLSKNIHKVGFLLKQINNYGEIEFKNSKQFININNKQNYEDAINIINKDNN